MIRPFSWYRSLSDKVRAPIWFALCVFLQKGITVLTTPIFTRILSTEEYGNFNVFNSWLEIVTIFVSLKLCAGVYLQSLVKFSEERYKFASSMQGLSFVLTLFWTIIYLAFRSFWNNIFSLTTVQMLSMLIMIWSSAAFNFWATAQRVELKYKALVAVTLISSVLKPVIGILFVVNAEDKVTARILGLALVEVVCFTGLFISQLRKGKTFFSKKFWKYALIFNLPLIPHYLSTSVLNSSDRIMIKKMIGPDEAGIYSLSYQLSQLITLFSTAIEQAIQPWIYSKIKQKKIGEIKKIIYPAFAIMICVAAMIMLCAPEVIAIFAPKSYSDAIWVIPPVTIGVSFVFAYTMFATFEFYYEKTNYIAAATVAGAMLNIILNYVFINKFGYIAAGYTTLICYFLFMCFHYGFMRKICRKNFDGEYPFSEKILAMLLAVIFMAGAISLITYNMPLVRYVILGAFLITIIIKRKLILSKVKDIITAKKGSGSRE